MTPEEQRTYRLDPLDRSGVFLGLGPGQLAVLATASLLGAVLLTVDAPIGIAGAPVVIGALVALSRVGNQRLVEWVPVVARFVARLRTNQYRWRAPLTPSHDHDASPAHRLPPCLHGVDVGDGRDGLGVVADTRADTRTAVLPVGSDEFVLLSREDQEQLLAGWGDVLAGFSAERSPVVRLCWSDYAAPRGLGDHARWAAAQAAPPRPAAWADYQALLSRASPWTVGHEVLLTVTVARSGLRARTATDGDLLDALGRAVDAIGRGLRSAGLHVGDPVSAQAIAAGIRSRAGGRCSTRTAVSLAERVGLVFAESAGPMAADDGWRRIRIDDAWHTTYWVASWPRSGRHPAWLEPILSWDGCVDEATAVRRELTVVLEPVAPSVSRRRVDREAIKLESDAAVREEKGRRVDAHHRRAQQAVAEREQELVAGHAELAYAGLLRVTASSVDALERGCDAVEQLAREHGVDLRPLYGRQDLAYTASLPLGLGLGRMVTG